MDNKEIFTLFSEVENEDVTALCLQILKLNLFETYIHSINTAILACNLLPYTGISRSDYKEIIRGALIHDIGKIAIPYTILNKPSTLFEEEYELVKLHPLYAHNLLSGHISTVAENICLMHHEKMNGKGYPKGITVLPDYVRFFTIIDIYEALVGTRNYKRQMKKSKAIFLLRDISHKGETDNYYTKIICDFLSKQKLFIPQDYRMKTANKERSRKTGKVSFAKE